MAKMLYLEGSCGISGDMTVAALLDLGADRKKLEAALDSLHLDGLRFSVERKNSYSVSGLGFSVAVHGADADATEHHEESYAEHHHHHEHRHLSEVLEIISRGQMTECARSLACRIFEIIAEAEARAHGVSKEEVHFHEVGALDSIADIVAVSVLADDLGIENCIVTGLAEGNGEVETQHGMLPIPVPAVANIAAAYGIALRRSSVCGEMVTPTGIAIAAALRTSETLPQSYVIRKIGVGIGSRDFGKANFLRAMILEDSSSENSGKERNSVQILEANIDDSTPEELGFAMDRLFAAGALDVSFSPCQMKKNRPGVLLRAIVPEENGDAVTDSILRFTTTIGVRKIKAERICMAREMIRVKTEFGEVEVKKCTWKDIVRFYPEYESVKRAVASDKAMDRGANFRDVYDEAARIAQKSAEVPDDEA